MSSIFPRFLINLTKCVRVVQQEEHRKARESQSQAEDPDLSGPGRGRVGAGVAGRALSVWPHEGVHVHGHRLHLLRHSGQQWDHQTVMTQTKMVTISLLSGAQEKVTFSPHGN